MKAVLLRLQESDVQTLGKFELWDGIDLKFQGKTLELPWRDNNNNVSRIPEGEYKVVSRKSKKYGEHFHVTGVDGRSLILIHVGNYYKQTEGCILVGQKYVDINKDGHLDVAISRPTMQKLLQSAPKSFILKVVDLF